MKRSGEPPAGKAGGSFFVWHGFVAIGFLIVMGFIIY
jgi:hypothetical protein